MDRDDGSFRPPVTPDDDDVKCFVTVPTRRRPDGVDLPRRGSAEVTKDGWDETQSHRQLTCGDVGVY